MSVPVGELEIRHTWPGIGRYGHLGNTEATRHSVRFCGFRVTSVARGDYRTGARGAAFRFLEELRRRAKTQASLPAQDAVLLLLRSAQAGISVIHMRARFRGNVHATRCAQRPETQLGCPRGKVGCVSGA